MIEIERKFLLKHTDFNKSTMFEVKQGYFLTQDSSTCIRVSIKNDKATLCIKYGTDAIERLEYEYPIPLNDAEQLFQLCQPNIIYKNRYHVMHAGKKWEVDEFLWNHAGLYVAEIELDSVDEAIDIPDWVGKEVTDDPTYLNVNLAQNR